MILSINFYFIYDIFKILWRTLFQQMGDSEFRNISGRDS